MRSPDTRASTAEARKRRLDMRSGEGPLLRLLGVVHALVGLTFYRREARAIARDGLVAGIPYRGPKSTLFWFLVPSPLIWIIGRLVSDAEAKGDWETVRAAHRLSLLSAAVAIVCMPVSGFWGWLAISGRGLRRARAATRRTSTRAGI